MLKSHSCGDLRRDHAGQTVTLAGWVHRRRDHGGLIFLDLRDRWGLTQIVANPATAPEAHRALDETRNEYVVRVTGAVRSRPAGMENPKMDTGAIEVEATEVTILNPAKTPPFYINEEAPVEEDQP